MALKFPFGLDMSMAPIVLLPGPSSEHIVKNAAFLHVRQAGIEKLKDEIVAGILDKSISVENFSQHQLHPKPSDANAVEWIFLLDTLNFCFWTPPDCPKYTVNGQSGYFALCAAIKRALDEGVDITNAKIYSSIDPTTLRHIFRSDDGKTEVPLLQERIDCLHEVGQKLLDMWDGKFENVIQAADNCAERLLHLVIKEFPCFRDEAEYAGQKVSLYKRAQILIGDVWACYRGEGLGRFDDIETITMFADYRVPQVLVHFGSLEYTPFLTELLEKDVLLKNGDPMEVEIRGASIYIVEKVKEAVLRELTTKHPDIPRGSVNSILIDHFLWDYRRKHAEELEHIPYHKVQSIYY